MFGCFRKGEANDAETYTAAIAATLANYPEDVVIDVTHPTKGLPIEKDWLPSVKDVYEACEARMGPFRQAEIWRKQVEKQLAERAEWEGKNLSKHIDDGFSPGSV